jgi:hypothetical protein
MTRSDIGKDVPAAALSSACQSLTETSQDATNAAIRRITLGTDQRRKPDYRHRALLRARSERPSNCRAEERAELDAAAAPAHVVGCRARSSGG